MSPLTEVELVMRRELRKSFRSVKGIVLAALSVTGGAGVSMAFAWMDRYKRENLPPGVDMHDAQKEFFTRVYNPETGDWLASCPYSLWIMLEITIWLGPLLVALMDFDAVSADMQHRSVRFWTVRSRRASYMVGKYLGAWAVVLSVTLALNVIVWVATSAVGGLGFGYVLGWGARFFLVSVPISAAWCGVATLVGSQFKQPMLSLLVIFASFFGLWLVWIIAAVSKIDWLAFVYPNFYDAWLLSPRSLDVGKGLLGTMLIAGLTMGASALAFQRRDI